MASEIKVNILSDQENGFCYWKPYLATVSKFLPRLCSSIFQECHLLTEGFPGFLSQMSTRLDSEKSGRSNSSELENYVATHFNG